MKGFLGGFALASVICISLAAWLIMRLEAQPVQFPSKMMHGNADYFRFTGSVYGEGEDAPINNMIDGRCYRDRMECEITSQNEIGNRFVGDLATDTIKVRRWDDRLITADSEGTDPDQCNWYEIRIDQKTEEIAYTRIPNKNPKPKICQGVARKVMRWRIDNGKAWLEDAAGNLRKS